MDVTRPIKAEKCASFSFTTVNELCAVIWGFQLECYRKFKDCFVNSVFPDRELK